MNLPRRVSIALLCVACQACEGEIRISASEAGRCLPPQKVRRLTRAEMDATFTDVLGRPVALRSSLAAEDMVLGYTGHDELLVSTLFADQLDLATATLSRDSAAAQMQALQCMGGEPEETCVRRFLSTFAARAWRRPVSPEELDDLVALYAVGRTGEDVQTGLATVIQGVLESTGALYRTELGEAAAGGVLALTQSEIAAELSYLAVGGPPDAELRSAAAAGLLQDPQVRVEHLRRLLALPAATVRLHLFVEQWLGLTNIGSVQKNNAYFPKFTSSLRDALAASARGFVDAVLVNSRASVPELLAADYTLANDSVAGFLGSALRPGTGLSRLSTADLPRRGLITSPALLYTFAHPDDGSPVLRGKVVRTRLLCENIPPPPPNVVAAVQPVSATSTTRERAEAHAKSSTCNSCHRLMDPIGFGLEGYDGFGEARTMESGKAIDDRGDITGSDVAGPFQGGVALATRLSQSAQVGSCATTQLARFSFGRKESPADACMLDLAKAKFGASDGSLHAALEGFVESDAFVKRSVSR